MISKLFICLANSKKYTQRCIAGIALTKSSRPGYTYQIEKRGDNPVWLRPVSNCEHGEVAAELVDYINLLDIVEFQAIEPVPQGYQSENILFAPDSLQVVDKIVPQEALLDKLLAVEQTTLFGNRGRTVSVHEVAQLEYSLMLIKPAQLYDLYPTSSSAGGEQIRANFVHGLIPYNLPITDIDFIERFEQNSHILHNFNHFYFTVSLGLPFNEQHYKLLAGVLYF